MSAVLEFITVTTGSTTMNARADSPDAMVAEMKRVIKPTPMMRVPGGFGCKVTAGDGAWAYSLFRGGFPVSTCIVCWDAAVSDTVWEIAQQEAPDTVVLHRPRGVPWLSARIEPTAIVAMPEAMEIVALAQTELAIAWAILEREAV